MRCRLRPINRTKATDMMTTRIAYSAAVSILFSFPCLAIAAPHPAPVYQDGVLVSFSTVRSGESCQTSGTATARSNGDGTATATSDGEATCSDVMRRHYTLKVGDSQFVVKPAISKKVAAMGAATIGWGLLFTKQSVLANLLPGTHILVRTDDQGFHVKVGKRESLYTVVSAQ